MPDLFQSPFIKPIERKVQYEEGRPKVLGKAKATSEISSPEPETEILLGQDPTIKLRAQSSPMLAQLLDKLVVVQAKATLVQEEATIMQKVMATGVPRSLIGAPQHIVDMVNELTYMPDATYGSKPGPGVLTEIQPCDMNCILDTAGYFDGGFDPNDIDATLKRLADAPTTAEAIQSQASELTKSIDGWQMFLFMVRFILAYACHMIIGFLYCYFRGKLCLRWGVRVFGKWIGFDFGCIGDWIADDIICPVDQLLQGFFGFGCAGPHDQCIQPDGSMPALDLRIFPCCTCDDPTRQTSFKNCVQQAVRQFSAPFYGGTGAKPCRMCDPTQQPDTKGDIKATTVAAQVADYFLGMGKVGDGDGNNPYNKDKITNTATMPVLKNTIGNAAAINQTAFKLGSAVNDSWSFSPTNNADLCKNLDDSAAKLAQLFSGKAPTKADLAQSLLNNLDTDLGPFLAEANKTRRLDIEGQNPPQTEPFKSLFEAVNGLDQQLGQMLDQHRKTISSIKSFTNSLSSVDFCCIIFTLVFLANIVRYGKICPEDDLSRLFKYADKIGNSADIQEIIMFLKFLRDAISVLNAEMVIGIEFIGIGLPLGTLVKLLKHIVGQSVGALFATAIAPLDKVLTDLASLPALQAQLNANCPGVVDLLLMLNCGIKWILDLIKELAAGLINISAQNQELLPDMRITSARFSFLANLLRLLDLMLDILLSIGDCYTPEGIADLITDGVAKAQIEGYQQVLDRLDQAGVTPEQYDKVGAPVAMMPGTSVDDALDEAEVMIPKATTTTVFPIYQTEFKPFLDVVRRTNKLTMVKAKEILANRSGLPIDPLEQADITFEIVKELGGNTVNREQLHKNLLNLVSILTSTTNKGVV